MLTREDYLLKFEKNLLDKLSENYISLNKNVLVCFSLLFIFLLFTFNLLSEISIQGNKLKINEDQLLLLMPILIMLPYLLINISIINITQILKRLKINSTEIIEINKDARPFDMKDLDFQTQGIAGIQLLFSKWVLKKYASKNILDFNLNIPQENSVPKIIKFIISFGFELYAWSKRFISNLLQILFWLAILLALFILPLVVCIGIIYVKKLNGLLFTFNLFQVFSQILMVLFLVSMIIFTVVSNLILFSFYLIELVEFTNNFTSTELIKFKESYKKILNYLSWK